MDVPFPASPPSPPLGCIVTATPTSLQVCQVLFSKNIFEQGHPLFWCPISKDQGQYFLLVSLFCMPTQRHHLILHAHVESSAKHAIFFFRESWESAACVSQACYQSIMPNSVRDCRAVWSSSNKKSSQPWQWHNTGWWRSWRDSSGRWVRSRLRRLKTKVSALKTASYVTPLKVSPLSTASYSLALLPTSYTSYWDTSGFWMSVNRPARSIP